MSATEYWFMDPRGMQQSIGADGFFAAVSRGDLRRESMFYDPSIGQWQPAFQSPLLAASFAAVSPPPNYAAAPPSYAIVASNPVAKVLALVLTVLAAGLGFLGAAGRSGSFALGAVIGAPLMVFGISWIVIKLSNSVRPWRVRAWVAALLFLGHLSSVANGVAARTDGGAANGSGAAGAFNSNARP